MLDPKRHPIPRPNERAMGYHLWIFLRKFTAPQCIRNKWSIYDMKVCLSFTFIPRGTTKLSYARHATLLLPTDVPLILVVWRYSMSNINVYYYAQHILFDEGSEIDDPICSSLMSASCSHRDNGQCLWLFSGTELVLSTKVNFDPGMETWLHIS